jgi:DHA1 family bicyclomycin/chloramphenicol resistance-like MFS transporter
MRSYSNFSVASLLPPLWLIVLIVGLPQLSETVYTPSLPDIAQALDVGESWVEYTLTIYLWGFALGTLFWGKLSDHLGRKPCMLMGLVLYTVGCISCFMSHSITLLMISRFIQAFGGSTGSVLGQAICRDAFHGKDRGRVYSVVSSALAFSPAVGPIMGGLIAQYLGWSAIFVLLTSAGGSLFFLTKAKLPETHVPHASASNLNLLTTGLQMLKDKRVIAFGVLIAACNGIGFSYYAEGPFYLINMLGLSPSLYGVTFLGIALGGMIGSQISRKLQNAHEPLKILSFGIKIVLVASSFFVIATFIAQHYDLPKILSIVLTLFSIIMIMLGIGIMLPNALSLALEDYRQAIGTAASLFGFFYYTLIALFTLGMGSLHNDTLYPMPIYFCVISTLMWVVFVGILAPKKACITQ